MAKLLELRQASIHQLAKINQLIADQHPTSIQLNHAMRLIPDLLKADLSKVNRFDLCRLIGRHLQFEICSPEYELEIDYNQPLVPRFSRWYNEGWSADIAVVISRLNRYEIKETGKVKHRFFVIKGTRSSFEKIDLKIATAQELFQSEEALAKLKDSLKPNVNSQRGAFVNIQGEHGAGTLIFEFSALTGKSRSMTHILPEEYYPPIHFKHYYLVRRCIAV